ncbi:hypothetical protein BGZ96_000705 [Linnemannia gamsii]|uniref:C2H2-type domain-containing protein n=1 Tax=Linnemannia gamsii TaxID=64522 RepID=A0ABQ7KB26_9FUNG|nr:hypothetical protein BGZ96_000705 [Linnemannia gamsii]
MAQCSSYHDHPPRCEHCPEAKFTSLAMLSTHYFSKRHLARVRKKQQSHNQDQAPQTDTEDQVIQSGPTPPTEEVPPISAANNGSSHDVIKENIAAASENIPTTQGQPEARPGKNATQRKRKQERDRKKVRARLEKRCKSSQGFMDQSVEGQVETKEDEATVSTSNELLEDAQRTSPMEDDDRSTTKGDIKAPLAHTNSSSPPVTGSDIVASPTVGVLPSTSNTTLPQQLQQQHWHCSICGSCWRQEKAWMGHLLSAQHLRHTLATMQKIAPDTRPYGRVDVMASTDPFGWGTGAGVVEEEEEDSDEGDSDDDNGSNVEGKALENDEDDDMDMSD